MAAPLFRNVSSGPGFIRAPKPIVCTRVDSGRTFECDHYPGAWAEAANEEAQAIIDEAIAAKKRRKAEGEGRFNATIVEPPTRIGMAHIQQLQYAAAAEASASPRPAPRRRAKSESAQS